MMGTLPYKVMICDADGTERAPLMDAVQIDWTLPRSGMGSITLAYPRSGQHHDWLATQVAATVDVPIRLYLAGQLCGELTCYLESVAGADISGALEGEVITFTGRTVGKLLDDAPVDIFAGELPYLPEVGNAGQILLPALARSQNELDVPAGVYWNATESADSAGVPWREVVPTPDVGRTSLLALLDALVAAKACEYRISEQPDGRVLLELFNWGSMTRDRPEVTFFAGRDMASASRAAGNTDRANALILMSNDGLMRAEATVPDAIAANGGRKRYAQKQFPLNVADQAALNSAAHQELALIPSAVSVVTITAIEHTPDSASFRPWQDYRLGDLVTNRTSAAAGFETVPVQAIALTVTEAGAIQSGVMLGADYRRVKVKAAPAAVVPEDDAYDNPYSGDGYDPYPGGDTGGSGGGGGGDNGGFAGVQLRSLTEVGNSLNETIPDIEFSGIEIPPAGSARPMAVGAQVTVVGRLGGDTSKGTGVTLAISAQLRKSDGTVLGFPYTCQQRVATQAGSSEWFTLAIAGDVLIAAGFQGASLVVSMTARDATTGATWNVASSISALVTIINGPQGASPGKDLIGP